MQVYAWRHFQEWLDGNQLTNYSQVTTNRWCDCRRRVAAPHLRVNAEGVEEYRETAEAGGSTRGRCRSKSDTQSQTEAEIEWRRCEESVGASCGWHFWPQTKQEVAQRGRKRRVVMEYSSEQSQIRPGSLAGEQGKQWKTKMEFG